MAWPWGAERVQVGCCGTPVGVSVGTKGGTLMAKLFFLVARGTAVGAIVGFPVIVPEGGLSCELRVVQPGDVVRHHTIILSQSGHAAGATHG